MSETTSLTTSRHDGVNMSQLGLGCAGLPSLTVDDARGLVHHALDRGITYFDTAYHYGEGRSEEMLGEVLAGSRDEVLLATKVGRYGSEGFDVRPQRLKSSAVDALRRLRCDHVDLLQLHDVEFSSRAALDDAIAVLTDLRDAGLTRHIGVTGYVPSLLAELVRDHPVDSVMVYCRGYLFDSTISGELAAESQSRGVALLNASPLCMGLLGSSGPPSGHPAQPHVRRAAAEIGAEFAAREWSLPSVALRYALALPGVTSTVIGATAPAHIDDAVAAMNNPLGDHELQLVSSYSPADPSWLSGLPEHAAHVGGAGDG